MNEDLQSIYKFFLRKYQSAGINLRPEELRMLINKEKDKALLNFNKLSKPKTCTKKFYIKNWVREEVERDFNTKTLRSINLDKPGNVPYAKALAEYFNLFPLEKLQQFNKKVYDAKPEKRLKVWKGLNIPVKKVDASIKKVIITRNQEAINKGLSSHLEFALNAFKIPNSKFKKVIENIEDIIDYCNKQLPKLYVLHSWFFTEFSSNCYKCELKTFPFNDYSDVIDFVEREYPILKKFTKKIVYKQGKKVYMNYKKEEDIFEIYNLESENFRHRTLFLLHELSHVVSHLECFKKGFHPSEKGKYFSENDVISIILSLLRKVSEELYQAYFGDILGILYGMLFELELYENPDQDLGKLRAKVFNQCFQGAKQRINRSYLMDESIIMSPLSYLLYAIASAHYVLENSKILKN